MLQDDLRRLGPGGVLELDAPSQPWEVFLAGVTFGYDGWPKAKKRVSVPRLAESRSTMSWYS